MSSMMSQLLGSKKFMALIAGMIALALVRLAGMDEAQATDLSQQLVALVCTYLVGQGVADMGKSAAIVKAADRLPR